jgi:hypothetical protein
MQAEVSAEGPFWSRRSVPVAALSRLTVELELHAQQVILHPWFGESDSFILTTGPETVAIVHQDGRDREILRDPRTSFPRAESLAPWNRIQVGYFLSYAVWNYLTAPYLFTYPGVRTREIAPWTEEGRVWRRLEVTFPDSIATHCPCQVFYFDQTGLLQRMDYQVEVSGGAPAAHYVANHLSADGFVFPTRRLVYPRRGDNAADRTFLGVEGSIICLNIDNIRLT